MTPLFIRPIDAVLALYADGNVEFDYRNPENLSALLATANFGNPHLVGSGNIYDVIAYEKTLP
jgi:hypothetical protein